MPTPPSAPSLTRALPRRADARGASRLAIDGVIGIADIVEDMHHVIARQATLGLLPAPVGAGKLELGGIGGLVYRTVRATARLTGRGLEALSALLPADPAEAASPSPQREAVVAALNGAIGDHLAASGNPLAIEMAFRVDGRPIVDAPPQATGRLLVLVHGLCMNDLQWTRNGHDHGQALAREAGFTPVYLHYNSGLHASSNGRAFSALLDDLVTRWPVPLDELVIVGHSMGGLVSRSACHVAEAEGHAWRRKLTSLVCLGTPHHGAPLERGGQIVDALLGVSRFSAPLARLGLARSAGITDLRFGIVRDEDWLGVDAESESFCDARTPMPLPEGVRCYLVAATTAASRRGVRSATIGDGLVTVASALGEHADLRRALHVPRDHTLVVTSANHFDLLSDERVHARLRAWLGR